MRQQGEIIKVENEREAWVKLVNPGSACGNCKGCIRLTPHEEPESQILKLDLKITAHEGDMVLIDYPNKGIFQAMLVMYGIPFLGLALGYIVTFLITNNDPIAGLGAVVGLIVFAILTRPVARKLNRKLGNPQIVAKSCQPQAQ